MENHSDESNGEEEEEEGEEETAANRLSAKTRTAYSCIQIIKVEIFVYLNKRFFFDYLGKSSSTYLCCRSE